MKKRTITKKETFMLAIMLGMGMAAFANASEMGSGGCETYTFVRNYVTCGSGNTARQVQVSTTVEVRDNCCNVTSRTTSAPRENPCAMEQEMPQPRLTLEPGDFVPEFEP